MEAAEDKELEALNSIQTHTCITHVGMYTARGTHYVQSHVGMHVNPATMLGPVH